MEENITHLVKTEFRTEFSYETLEVFAFCLLGILCGFLGHFFVCLQRKLVLFNRKKLFHKFLQRFPLVYPVIISLFISSIKFPDFIGNYFTSKLTMEDAMHELFSNFTWGGMSILNATNEEIKILNNWQTPYTSVYINSFLFFVVNFFIIALASTVPGM